MGAGGWTTMQAAWRSSLYGPHGFYRSEQPADHFRTSTHVSADFAAVVVAIAAEHRVGRIVDVGAGGGELLAATRGLQPDLELVGVELRERPPTLPPDVDWRIGDGSEASTACLVAEVADGPTLLIANELLDNVPADVVELAADGLREIEVHADGRKRLGAPASPAVEAWVEEWWPVDVTGQRVVVGQARDDMWAALCGSVAVGVCVAVDYGHRRDSRPPSESPDSYRGGRRFPGRLDGRHDLAAPVAVDAVAARVGGRLARQRDVVERRLPRPPRPDLGLATSNPAAYLRQLGALGERRELTDADGLGGFWWIETPRGRHAATATMGAESEVAP